MNFKEWLKLQEVGTGTNAIAVFARPVFDEPWRRGNYDDLKLGDHHKKKRKKKGHHHEELPGLAD